MTDEIPHDVEIHSPSYWITHVEELRSRLAVPGAAIIRSADPSLAATEESLLVVDPSYWADNVDALIEVLVDRNSDGVLIPKVHMPDLTGTEPDDDGDVGAESPEPINTTFDVRYEAAKRDDTAASDPPPARLTLTVEEAAATLGISRAFAYEAVRRGEIPSIRIGRRVLVPRAALNRL
nr:helix-turn-helix domain-containing protein [Actinomycetota bacterium]